MTAAQYARLDEDDLRIRLVADTLDHYDLRVGEFDSYDAAESWAEGTRYWQHAMAAIRVRQAGNAIGDGLRPMVDKANRLFGGGKVEDHR